MRERELREEGAGLKFAAALAEVGGSTAGGNAFVLRTVVVDAGALVRSKEQRWKQQRLNQR